MSQIKWSHKKGLIHKFRTFKNLKKEPDKRSWQFNEEQNEEWYKTIKAFIADHNLEKVCDYNTVNKAFLNLYKNNYENSLLNVENFVEGIQTYIQDQLPILREQEHIFIFRIKNLKLDKPFESGNIIIANTDQIKSDGKTILQTTLDILNKIEETSENGDTNNRDSFLGYLNSTLLDTVIQITEKGDAALAKDKALNQARNALNEIFFFASLSSFLPIFPCLELENPIESNFVRIGPTGLEMEHGAATNKYFPTFFSLETNDNASELAQKLTQLLKEYDFPIFQKTTEVYQRISTSISWYARACKESDVRIKFLFFCIGLEALFSVRKNKFDPVIPTLCDNCCAILFMKESRPKFKKIIEKIYDLRSQIAHGSAPDIPNPDLEEISEILYKSILCLIKTLSEERTITDDASLLKYYEKLKAQ